jgi:hypothetical protein
MRKIIETHLSRKFTVESSGWDGGVIFTTENTNRGGEISSRLLHSHAVDLGVAVLEEAGQKVFTYEGTLPGVGTDNGFLVSGQGMVQQSRSVNTSPEDIVGQIKALIAIHKTLLKREEAAKTEAEQKRVAEETLRARRDALVNEFAGTTTRSYSCATEILQSAVDYAIELEDKLEAKTGS